MTSWLTRAQEVPARFAAARVRSPLVDHGVMASVRYSSVRGTQLAASITYYGFLALFPLIALVYAVVEVLSTLIPALKDDLNEALADLAPTLQGGGAGQIELGTDTRGGVILGLIALGVLIYAGMRWIMTMRWSLHAIAGQGFPRGRDAIWGFVRDLVVLLLLGVAFIVSMTASALLTEASSWLLDLIGIDGVVQRWVVGALAVVVVMVADVVLAAIVIAGLSGAKPDRTALLVAAAAFAAGFSLLKTTATWIVGFALSNPIYGTFALTIGVLIWINWSSRLLLMCSAWALTSSDRGESQLAASRSASDDTTDDDDGTDEEQASPREDHPARR